jgi:hypothetical protein
MYATQEQFDTHQSAYEAWQAAGVDYWQMIDELRRGQPVDDVVRAAVLERFDATHKAWMLAGEPLSRPRRN